MTAQEILARNIKNLMIIHKYSNTELAKKAKVSQTHICGILRNKYCPSLNLIERIAEVFNVSVAELFAPDAKRFGEEVNKDEELMKLAHENVCLKTQLNKWQAEPAAEHKDNKVKLDICGSKINIEKNGEQIEVACLENVQIRRRSATITLNFDELTVRSEEIVQIEIPQQED